MGSILSLVYLYIFPRRKINLQTLTKKEQTTKQIKINSQIQKITQKQPSLQKKQNNKLKLQIPQQIQNLQQKGLNSKNIKPRSKLYPAQEAQQPQYIISLDQLQGKTNVQAQSQQAREQIKNIMNIENNNQTDIQHYMVKIESMVKQEVFNTTTLVWIKQGIQDFHQKYVERYKFIFNLKIFQSLEDLIFNLENIQSFCTLPTRIICHYSAFKKVHSHFAHNAKIISINIFNCDFIDFQPNIEQTQKMFSRQCQFLSQKQNLYKKLGKVSGQIVQMRQKVISQTINEESVYCVHFQPYFYQNKQFIDLKKISIKSALLLQNSNSLNEKQKAKQDLIKLVSLIFDNQIYLQYITELNRKSYQENNLKQNRKNVYAYIQDILAIFKAYPIQILYENLLTRDKQKIYLLEQLQQLKARPITSQAILWKILQFFVFNFRKNLALDAIKQYFHRNSSPLEICYIRLMISDMSMCIKQLYKLYDQKKIVCECYYSSFADENLIKGLKQSISKTIQLQQFLLCNLKKGQQMNKPGNIFFMITVNNNERQFQSDYGFIKFQNCQQFNSKFIEKNQAYKNKILFNVLSHFYVDSITFDSIYDKLIVKLTYGYTSSILKRYNQDRISLSKEELIHVYYWLNNQNVYNIKDQGQALRLAKMYEYSLSFYQQALVKAKRQAPINRQKTAKIYYNSGLTLKQKQILNRAVQQFNNSISEKQKKFGQKCGQSLEDYQQQAYIFVQQQQLQRAVRIYETMLTITNREIKQQNSNCQMYREKKVKYNFLLGKAYEKMVKHQLAQKQYIKSIALGIQQIGEFQLLTAQIYIALGDLYLKIHLASKATFNYKKGLVIRLNIYGQNHILTAECYKKLGDSTDMDLQYEHSYRYYNSAFQIYSKFYDKNHDQIIESYNNLGKALYNKNYFDDAITDFKVALQITIKKYGVQNLKTGQFFYHIGECYKKKGDYLSAIQMFQKNKSLSLKLLSPNHPQTNKCYKELGEICQKQGKYNEAIQYYQKPLINLIKNKGQLHKDTIQYYEKLGYLYMKMSREQIFSQKQQKKYEIKGIGYLKKILDIRFAIQKNSLQTASAYDALGRAHLIKKDDKNAEGYFQQAFSIKKLILKQQNDINYAISYCNFGEIMILRLKYQDSINFFQKALQIKMLKLGQNHPQIAQIYQKIGYCYLKKTQYGKSQQNYRKCLAIKLSIHGSYNPETALTHYEMGVLYQQKRQLSRSLQMLAKSIETMRNLKLLAHPYYRMFQLKFFQVIMLIKNKDDLKELRHAFYYLNNFNPQNEMIQNLRNKIKSIQEQETKELKRKIQ